ncbi:MAG: hypothetical protein LUF89_07265 [Ruminococcus sp.]|nr:hypothetical protein [Ruminococcus sp.]
MRHMKTKRGAAWVCVWRTGERSESGTIQSDKGAQKRHTATASGSGFSARIRRSISNAKRLLL